MMIQQLPKGRGTLQLQSLEVFERIAAQALKTLVKPTSWKAHISYSQHFLQNLLDMGS